MKAPKYFVETMQDALNVGLNAFALQLMAEAFADDFDKFKNENVVVLMHDHNHGEVWMILTKTRPCAADFDGGKDEASK